MIFKNNPNINISGPRTSLLLWRLEFSPHHGAGIAIQVEPVGGYIQGEIGKSRDSHCSGFRDQG